MINTVFLSDQSLESKSFVRPYSIMKTASEKISFNDRQKIFNEVTYDNKVFKNFVISLGKVYLNNANEIYSLEHIPGNADIVLPKANRILDWVVLWYDQDRAIANVSFERHSKLKIYGNGARIMGYDEPLVCDMPFMSLRLTYLSDSEGWVVT